MKRIGILGGGQLAWMMGLEAESLGIELVIQTPHPTDPAVSLATDTIFAPIDDAKATATLAARCDLITFENEFINLDGLIPLAQQGTCFRPHLESLAPLLDKYQQRCYLQSIGLPQPDFIRVDRESDDQHLLSLTLKEWGFPCVLKTLRHGYDGQGTFIIPDQNSFVETWEKLDKSPVLLEKFIPFERELAVIAARSIEGKIVVYPVVETQQENQVCRRVFVPAPISSEALSAIESIAHRLLTNLQAIGVFGIELFLTQTGNVLVNEISPRTHNSGHFSLDACETSQFKMHLQAVAGLPLGSPALKGEGALMVNLLGYEYSHHDYREKRQKLASLPQTWVHWYGKNESRPGRKLGHVTVLLTSKEVTQAQAIAQNIESLWYG